MAAYKSSSGNSNICVISVLAPVDIFFIYVEVFLALSMTSDFQLYAGHFGYYKTLPYLNLLTGHLITAWQGWQPRLPSWLLLTRVG